jgi:hypothetical protein
MTGIGALVGGGFSTWIPKAGHLMAHVPLFDLRGAVPRTIARCRWGAGASARARVRSKLRAFFKLRIRDTPT